MRTETPRGPGRGVIAARQLVEEWAQAVIIPKLRVFDGPREAYIAFAEWLYGKVGGVTGEYSNAFTSEVFRRMLPYYEVFQMVWAYLPKQSVLRRSES